MVAHETWRETRPVPGPVGTAVLISTDGDITCSKLRCKWQKSFFPLIFLLHLKPGFCSLLGSY